MEVFNSLHAGKFFKIFCDLLIFSPKIMFKKKSFRNTRVSDSLNPDNTGRYESAHEILILIAMPVSTKYGFR